MNTCVVFTLSLSILEVIKRQKDLKIVYTPIHGTGMMLIPQSLEIVGIRKRTLRARTDG